jgi:hypothetical protein
VALVAQNVTQGGAQSDNLIQGVFYMTKWYSELTPDERAIKILRSAQSKVPAKQLRVQRVLSNAVHHLNHDIHPDNIGACKELWKSLK